MENYRKINTVKMIPSLSKYKVKYYIINDLLEDKIKMKFDYIVGNPPYQDSNTNSNSKKLYFDITKRILDMSYDSVSFLTPNTIVGPNKKRFQNQKMKGLVLVDHSVTKYFDVGVDIVYWKVKSNYDVDGINVDGEIRFNDLLVPKEDLIKYHFFERIRNLSKNNKLFIRGDISSDSGGKYKYTINAIRKRFCNSNKKPLLLGKRKLAISTSRSYNKEYLLDSFDNFGNIYVQVDISDKNEKQVKNIINFLYHPIMVNICNKYRKLYGHGMLAILYNFPQVSFDLEYIMDKDIINQLNISSKELKWLLS